MLYNLLNDYQRERFEKKVEQCLEKKSVVELNVRGASRTSDQNALLHLWLRVFADYIGEPSIEDVKRDVKRAVLGRKTVKNVITGQDELVDYETHNMNVKEMEEFLYYFKSWAMEKFGVYLPYYKDAEFGEMARKYKDRL